MQGVKPVACIFSRALSMSHSFIAYNSVRPCKTHIGQKSAARPFGQSVSRQGDFLFPRRQYNVAIFCSKSCYDFLNEYLIKAERNWPFYIIISCVSLWVRIMEQPGVFWCQMYFAWSHILTIIKKVKVDFKNWWSSLKSHRCGIWTTFNRVLDIYCQINWNEKWINE